MTLEEAKECMETILEDVLSKEIIDRLEVCISAPFTLPPLCFAASYLPLVLHVCFPALTITQRPRLRCRRQKRRPKGTWS
jgi:hypothetical protein